jgi:hypothetical protein
MPSAALLTGVLPLLGVLVGAGLQFAFGRTLEVRKQIQKQRAQAYADFFKQIAAIAKFGQTKDNQALLADAKTRICVYGAPGVITALGEFERSGANLADPQSRHLLILVLEQMRIDVGGGSAHLKLRGDLSWIIFGPAEATGHARP